MQPELHVIMEINTTSTHNMDSIQCNFIYTASVTIKMVSRNPDLGGGGGCCGVTGYVRLRDRNSFPAGGRSSYIQ